VVELPLRENPYLCYLLFGGYPCTAGLPPYLRPERFEAIRGRLDRIEIVDGACEDFFPTLPDDAISRFNLTNIFEWMAPAGFEALLAETVRVARDGAVLTYRNLLVPRSRPAALASRLVPDLGLARELHERDRSFIYRAYVVERVRKP
jgi:S-adenosylmethionine-diacylglycerol 3-amino-3-carboxypropyl transferase